MKTAYYYLAAITMVIHCLAISSCASKNDLIYSDKILTKLPKVDLTSYKSPQLRMYQDSTKAIGLAISGGGSRAQYFGLGVLIGLDDVKVENNSFLKEIDYFSTVSGGGFATGYYMSLVHNNVLTDYASLLDYWKSNIRKDSLQEYLYKDATVSSILKLKFYERNLISKSYPSMIDNELLQFGKKYKSKEIKGLFLRDFFIPISSSQPVTLPIFVANGTVYNNGERFPFMPHIISYSQIKGSLLPKKDFDSTNGYDFPLSYAIAGSAAFPGVLPMLKLSLDNDSGKVIRIIDGGIVDNLGFTTLFELLNSDKIEESRKGLLIVDCSGLEPEEREQKDEKVNLLKLLPKALLYAVDAKLAYADRDIDMFTSYYKLEKNKVRKLGLINLKKKYLELEGTMNNLEKQELVKYKDQRLFGKLSWEDIYRDLANSDNFQNSTVHTISEVPRDRFPLFTAKELFIIYDLSSKVKTKINIDSWEKEILVLAGRYVVYLEENNIVKIATDL